VLVGGPGEVLSQPITVTARDGLGRPLAGVALRWEAVGQGARVLAPEGETDAGGVAEARWLLGVDAAELQVLRITARMAGQETRRLVHARAVAHVVSRLGAVSDAPAILRLGDSLKLDVTAVDPFGNPFPAPSFIAQSSDTSISQVAGSTLVGGPLRGHTWVRLSSAGVTDSFPVEVVQHVAAIAPVSDTLHFTAIGAVLPLSYTIRDDRGLLVRDTTAAMTVSDPSVAVLTQQEVRSVASGTTHVSISIGSARSSVAVQVRQQIASLALSPDTMSFTALMDTISGAIVAHDSLGYLVQDPQLQVTISDPRVAHLDSPMVVQALAPGSAILQVSDPVTAHVAQAVIQVRQTPVQVGIDIRRSGGFSFAMAGDSIGTVWAMDRNGYRLPSDRLQIIQSDSLYSYVAADGTVRARSSGVTTLQVHADSLVVEDTLVIVRPVEVQASAIADFAVIGLPDSLGPWAPTALIMPDSTTRLFFTGYVYDSIQAPPFSGSLHYASSSDGVHFVYRGVALPRDSGYSGYRSQGVENVFVLPRDDGPGCRMLASAGSSWWIWQIYSAVSDNCDSWTWEDGPALPGTIENDTIGRPNGEGIYAWRDSTGQLWMLAGAYPVTPGDVRTWTIALYRGVSQRQWEFVRTVLYPGPSGSGRERAVFGPSVVQIAPGLYRMFFAGDDLGIGPGGGRSRIWSAVSRDRLSWTFEGEVLDFGQATRGPRYPTIVGNRLYYVNSGPGFGAHLGAAQIQQP
jgi:hypothetical protein